MSSPNQMNQSNAVNQSSGEVIKCLGTVVSEVSACEKVMSTLHETHARLSNEEKIIEKQCISGRDSKLLKNQYTSALDAGEKEEAALRNALKAIQKLRKERADLRHLIKISGQKETMRRGALMTLVRSTAQTLPLYVNDGNEIPPLCGAIPPDPSHTCERGDMVAVRLKNGTDENWILAEVMSYNASSKTYEIEDIDEEQKERHTFGKKQVIPLPKWRVDPETCPQAMYHKGSTVFAIYPQTTTFYKAIIDTVPTTAHEDYEVLFEDPQYPNGYSPPLAVAQRYIIPLREKDRKLKI